MLWLGPRTPLDVQAHFNSFFLRTVETTGDIFLVSSTAELEMAMDEMAKAQGNYRRTDEAVDLRTSLTPCGHKRWAGFQQDFKLKGSPWYIGDISQNSEKRKRSGQILPAICTTSVFYSFSKDRLFLPKDVMRSQGWPAPDGAVYGSCLPFDRSSLKLSEERALMGNGMHLAQVGMFFLYIVSHTMKREVALTLWPMPIPLPAPSVEEETEDA
jgi:hypothetical protein